SRDPFEGLAPAARVAIGCLVLYAALTLSSALWSHSTSRALIEFDRAWMYLLVLVLFATVRASAANLRWLIRGLAVGAWIVCLAGLISRVAPDVWHTAPDVSNQRLSYPVTYWNALGLLASLGIILTLHLTCTRRERRLMRVLAAGVLPLLAATLFFTFSRGAIAAGAIGLVVYVVVARPTALLSGVLATVPATAALVVIAFHANLLDTVDPTTPAAVAQGHRVALAAVVCSLVCATLRLLLAARVDSRLHRTGGRRWTDSPRIRATIAGAAAAVVAVALALGAPHAVARDWNRFFSGVAPRGNQGDLRQRLTDPSNNGRSDLWKVAVRGFTAEPVHGHGAGTYQTLWDRERPRFAYTVNAHSLYLQTMAELGVPGLLLLVTLIATVLVGLARRARGPKRSLYGALLAVGVVWAVHAGVDWDWEMPVVTLPFFAAAGLALSPRGGALGRRTIGRAPRIVLAGLCLAAVVLPVLLIGSQSRLTQAERALYASNCAKADAAANSSIDWLGARPEPYEILGFCDLQRGLPTLAVAQMRRAVRRDPSSWERYYALALAQASAGIDPRPAAARALQMNPHEPLTQQAVTQLRGANPSRWVRAARTVRAAALTSNDLSIVPS
ncbi:MAG TPA: O-antigen ligase family protein, partial [Solirubrobacteraceae bacterium]|nr:O-antigen ligase family protein [Solirubrobacteraceae bacterium]